MKINWLTFIAAATGQTTAASRKCEFACFRNYEPVCGTNGVTYSNRCDLNQAQCVDPTILLAYAGECLETATPLNACSMNAECPFTQFCSVAAKCETYKVEGGICGGPLGSPYFGVCSPELLFCNYRDPNAAAFGIGVCRPQFTTPPPIWAPSGCVACTKALPLCEAGCRDCRIVRATCSQCSSAVCVLPAARSLDLNTAVTTDKRSFVASDDETNNGYGLGKSDVQIPDAGMGFVFARPNTYNSMAAILAKLSLAPDAGSNSASQDSQDECISYASCDSCTAEQGCAWGGSVCIRSPVPSNCEGCASLPSQCRASKTRDLYSPVPSSPQPPTSLAAPVDTAVTMREFSREAISPLLNPS